MDIENHYHLLYKQATHAISNNEYKLDSLVDSVSDQRRGITLIIRPSEEVKLRIQEFLQALKEVEPAQYYYPQSDIHVTVMSVISAYEGFDLSMLNLADYFKLIAESLRNIKPFEINFRGITASPSCVMIQGFTDDSLNILRNQLRADFKTSKLEQSIDKRYAIETAHSTVVRFKEELQNIDKLLAILEKYRDFCFGSFPVHSIELVHNNWYHQRDKTSLLKPFILKG